MSILKWTFIVLALASFIAYGVVAFRMATALTTVTRHAQDDTPAKHNLSFTNVSFPSRGEDVMLDGWYIAKPTNKATLVFIHGIGGTRSSLQRVDLAARLVSRGFNILMFDLRGHGTSGGDRVSGGYFEQADVLGAFDFLRKQGTTPQCIGMLGSSMGAAATLLAAAKEPIISAVVADSSYADISDLIVSETVKKSSLPGWSIPFFIPGMKLVAQIYYYIDLNSLKPEQAIHNLSYPVLVIHGLVDARIPVAQSQRLAAMAPVGSELWLVPEAEHANAFAHQSDEYTKKVIEYFNNRLPCQ